jgi:hypothetical protein
LGENTSSNKSTVRSDIKEVLKHMAGLRSFWLLVLCSILVSTASTMVHIYFPNYLQSIYISQPSLMKPHKLILTITSSISILSGGTTCCLPSQTMEKIAFWTTASLLLVSTPLILPPLFLNWIKTQILKSVF